MSLKDYPLIGDWITFANGRALVHTGKVDIGQRISTALMQIAHEELGLSYDQIDIAPVRTGHAPDEGITSGSNSIEQSGHALRCAAATLAAEVRHLAAARMGGEAADWRLDDGTVHLPGSNHRLVLLDLAAEVPADTRVDADAPLRPRSTETAPPPMRHISEMVQGRYTFIHDLERPDMLHARVLRPPHVRARLTALDEETVARLREDGLQVIRDGSFLAIAGDSEWAVLKALPRLARACDWDTGGGMPEQDIFEQLTGNEARRFLVVDGIPTDQPIPAPAPDPDFTARYERPYQMHAPLAPSAAMAEWTGQTLILHSQSQGIYALRSSIADSLDLGEAQVDITHVPGSGCYGHTGADDAAFEAALVAMAIPNRPILLKWTREDEHAWEPYAPAMVVEVAARQNGGRIGHFAATAYSDTHRGRPRPGPGRSGPSRLVANWLRESPIDPNPAQPNMGNHAGIHRNLEPIYSFPDMRLVKTLVSDLPHRTSAMRCLGGAANVFALESCLDEIARRDGIDPIAFRRAHLDDDRALALLDELERQLAQRPAPAEGQGRGIAYVQYKNQMTRVAMAVDIEVTERAEVRLLTATIIADAGRVVDPDGLTAQLEGGFLQAASWALHEQVIWDRDGIQSRDWDSYPVLRFDNIPRIDVTLLDVREAKSVGAGEASPGPTLAAIANALEDAIGIRMRRLPFTPDSIMAAAQRL